MENEKIKEIKRWLEKKITRPIDFTRPYEDTLDLINELENENKRLQNDCADIAKDYQEMAKFYDEKCEECERISKKTANDILNELEGFLWETAINDTKFFDLYQSLYRSIKEHIKNKYGVIKEN